MRTDEDCGTNEYTTELTSRQQLRELLEEGGGRTAVIDFWAPWCDPCEDLNPRYEQLAEEMVDEPVEFFEVDTREHPELTKRLHLRSIPTLVFLHDGEVVETTTGAPSLDQLREQTHRLLEVSQRGGFLGWLLG
jgi:thioredoxin